MAIQEVTTVTATCDLCEESIDTAYTYVDAMTYGAAFHLECVQDTDAFAPLDILRALNLMDDLLAVSGKIRKKLSHHF